MEDVLNQNRKYLYVPLKHRDLVVDSGEVEARDLVEEAEEAEGEEMGMEEEDLVGGEEEGAMENETVDMGDEGEEVGLAGGTLDPVTTVMEIEEDTERVEVDSGKYIESCLLSALYLHLLYFCIYPCACSQL